MVIEVLPLMVFNILEQYLLLWTEAERNAIGIYAVEIDESKKKDEKWYINTNITYAFDGSKVTGSYGDATAKAHADTKWIQSEIDAGDAPEGADTDTVKEEGLKTEEEVKKALSSAKLIS